MPMALAIVPYTVLVVVGFVICANLWWNKYRYALLYNFVFVLALYGFGKPLVTASLMPYEQESITYYDIIDIPGPNNGKAQIFWEGNECKKLTPIVSETVNSADYHVQKITYKTNYNGLVYPPCWKYSVVKKDKK